MAENFVLDQALAVVAERGASDLHLTVGMVPTMRFDGDLEPLPGYGQPLSSAEVRSALTTMLTGEQLRRFEADRELDFAYHSGDAGRFRVNAFWQRGEPSLAFRFIESRIRSLRELGMPDTVRDFAFLPRGLVLVTGPTGSGKSTTLASLINIVNAERASHVVTIEDPIEFVHANKRSIISQREVGADTRSFADALKHVLRQDPDVILIGELRDLESISAALTAAETGHLVFATLHTVDATQSIDRIIDVFPPHQQGQVRVQLASTLRGVVSQTLLKRREGGRIAATEVLWATPAIANLIREGDTHQIYSALQSGADHHMHSLDQSLAQLVHQGRVLRADARERANDRKSFDTLALGAREAIGDAANQMSRAGAHFDDMQFTSPENRRR